MIDKIKTCIKTLEDLAIDTHKASVRADNYYTDKFAAARSTGFRDSARILKEAFGLYKRPARSATPQATKDDSFKDLLVCASAVHPDEETIELTVLRPEVQSVTILKSDLPLVIGSLEWAVDLHKNRPEDAPVAKDPEEIDPKIESAAKELFNTLAGKGFSLKEADDALWQAKDLIDKLRFEPLEALEKRPLSELTGTSSKL